MNELVISLEELHAHLVAPNLEACLFEDEAGEIVSNYPIATLSDGANVLYIVEANLVQFLLEKQEKILASKTEGLVRQSLDMIKELRRELGYRDRNIQLLEKRLERSEQQHIEELQKRDAEYKSAIEENRQYLEWYGKLVTPTLLAAELWNGGAVAKWGFTIPRSEWKVAVLRNSSTDKAVRYWLSTFEEWGMIRTYGKGKVMAMMTRQEALEKIYEEKEKRGMIPDTLEAINEKTA